jgi:hypothetical protein
MPLMSIPGHYDGKQILLDEDVELRPNTRLIVTVIDDADPERKDFHRLSASALASAYSDEEVEYSEADLRK